MLRFYRFVGGVVFCVSALSVSLHAQEEKDPPKPRGYQRYDIAHARYKSGGIKAYLQDSYSIKERLDEEIVGQGEVTQALQAALIRYFEGYGTRTAEPVYLNLIGLTGLGKTSLFRVLEDMGFPVKFIQLQAYSGQEWNDLPYHISRAVKYYHQNQPLILVLDELDKVAEISGGDSKSSTEETTQKVVGTINDIISEGKLRELDLDLSNVFVVTTMNFSREEVSRYIQETFRGKKNQKDFFDFTIADLQKFHRWLSRHPSAKYKVISNIFRPNTTGRVAPNTVMVKPFDDHAYDALIALQVYKTVERETTGANAAKRIEVDSTPAFRTFLKKWAIFPPTGARETVMKGDALIADAILYGTKYTSGELSLSRDRPRKLLLDYDSHLKKVVVRITPQFQVNGKLKNGKTVALELDFDPSSKTFVLPEGVKSVEPVSYKHPPKRASRVTLADVRAARYPKIAQKAEGLSAKLNETLYGMEDLTSLIEEMAKRFLSRQSISSKEPEAKILASFPGVGKTDLLRMTAEYLGIPFVQVDLKEYTSADSSVIANFIYQLNQKIKEATNGNPGQPYVLGLEELDKLYEINPKTGGFVDRTLMSLINRILSEGKISGEYGSSLDSNRFNGTIDFHNAFILVTMNFMGDIIGFSADPRLTTVEDVVKASKELASTPAVRREVLKRIYLPETISRLFPYLHIVRSPDRKTYSKIIREKASVQAVKERLLSTNGELKTQVEIDATDRYYDVYLFNESVIPSEGARYSMVSAARMVKEHIEKSLAALKGDRLLHDRPVRLRFDFDPETSEWIVFAAPIKNDSPVEFRELHRERLQLVFPPIWIKRNASSKRLLVAVHEFGHAFSAIHMGLRIEYMTCVPPDDVVGGYVKYASEQMVTMASKLISRLYSGLASRAFERIFLSQDGAQPESVLKISTGSSGDIASVTQELWYVLYELGLDPDGGTLDRKARSAYDPLARSADFEQLPTEKVEAFGKILRGMESELVRRFLVLRPIEWYREKISEFALKGGMNEKQFYALIGYRHPGDEDNAFLGERSQLEEHFKKIAKPLHPGVIQAFEAPPADGEQTPEKNLSELTQVFHALVKEHLHGGDKAELCAASLTP